MKRYFDHLNTLAAIKAEYKNLVKKNHPDVGGDTATMQEINAQYAEAVKRIAKYGEGFEREQAAAEVPEEFAAVVAQVINLPGLDIDLVGVWLWATGATYQHRDALKAAGFRWANKKHAWYWHTESASVGRASKKTLEQIKDKYGSERLAGSGRVALTA